MLYSDTDKYPIFDREKELAYIHAKQVAEGKIRTGYEYELQCLAFINFIDWNYDQKGILKDNAYAYFNALYINQFIDFVSRFIPVNTDEGQVPMSLFDTQYFCVALMRGPRAISKDTNPYKLKPDTPFIRMMRMEALKGTAKTTLAIADGLFDLFNTEVKDFEGIIMGDSDDTAKRPLALMKQQVQFMLTQPGSPIKFLNDTRQKGRPANTAGMVITDTGLFNYDSKGNPKGIIEAKVTVGHGPRPMWALFDEIHQFAHGKFIKTIRLGKKDRSVLRVIMATNAGESQSGYYQDSRDELVKNLEAQAAGDRDNAYYNGTEAGWFLRARDSSCEGDKLFSDETVKEAAVGLYPVVVPEDSVELLRRPAMTNKDDEAEYKRFVLGITPRNNNLGYTESQWDVCQVKPNPRFDKNPKNVIQENEGPISIGLIYGTSDKLIVPTIMRGADIDQYHWWNQHSIDQMSKAQKDLYNRWRDEGLINVSPSAENNMDVFGLWFLQQLRYAGKSKVYIAINPYDEQHVFACFRKVGFRLTGPDSSKMYKMHYVGEGGLECQIEVRHHPNENKNTIPLRMTNSINNTDLRIINKEVNIWHNPILDQHTTPVQYIKKSSDDKYIRTDQKDSKYRVDGMLSLTMCIGIDEYYKMAEFGKSANSFMKMSNEDFYQELTEEYGQDYADSWLHDNKITLKEVDNVLAR